MDQENKMDEVMEQLGSVDTYQEQMEAFLQELSLRSTMTPTQREIELMSIDELTAENELVQQKRSTRSAAQRKYIAERFEREQNTDTDEK
jgi:DNA gyrase/topoisomerase IV subunit B